VNQSVDISDAREVARNPSPDVKGFGAALVWSVRIIPCEIGSPISPLQILASAETGSRWQRQAARTHDVVAHKQRTEPVYLSRIANAEVAIHVSRKCRICCLQRSHMLIIDIGAAARSDSAEPDRTACDIGRLICGCDVGELEERCNRVGCGVRLQRQIRWQA